VQKTGVFADDKVVVIAGVARGDGLYELYVDRIEYLDKRVPRRGIIATPTLREQKSLRAESS